MIGELYPGEFEAMEHNGRMDALEQESCEDWCDVPSDEMTLEQARQAVKDLRKKLAEYLEQEPCPNVISRSDMLDAIGHGTTYTSEDLQNIIKALPPVNAQPNKEDIYREREQAYMCGYEDGSRKYRTEQSEDAISRQAAIDALDKRFDSIPMEQTTEILLLRKDLRGLPPIYPEPSSSEKPNKWIPVSEPPEYGKEVLTYSDGGFIEIQSLENPYDAYWENQKGELADFDEVIAWMPLPDPYESQEREDKECI